MTTITQALTSTPPLTSVDLTAWSTRVRVVVTDPSAAAAAESVTRDWLDRVDRACSRFREDSDLSRVNAAAGASVPVGQTLVVALQAALEAARVTDGLVTPTVGAALCAAGYDRTFPMIGGGAPSDLPRLARPDEVVEVGQASPDWRLVRVDPTRATVRLPLGCRLDLGSTTKAWAADVLAEDLARGLGCGVLVDLGGDVVAAGAPPAAGWLVQVVDGPVSSGVGPLVHIVDGALATSSTVVRRWVSQGRERHHIIDPRTGAPSDDLWRTVTVSAATCLDANVASTACVVLAADGPDWLAEVGLPARLVRRDGVVLTLNGWPEDEPEARPAAGVA